MKRRAFLILLVTLILAGMTVACAVPVTPVTTQEGAPSGAEEPEVAEPGVYKIGAILPLTGDAAPFGQSIKNGMQLAADVVNEAGGIDGVPVEIIFEDDRLSATDAQTAFLKLVRSDNVPAVLGSTSSTVTLSYCPRAQELEVVQVSPTSTNPAVKDCGPYTFSMMASDTAQGPEWARVAEHLGVNEAAVMYLNNDYGIGLKDSFVEAFEAQGGEVLITQPFEVGAKDFRTEILKVRETNPELVFIVDHLTEGGIVLKQAAELGMDAQWVCDSSMVLAELPELAAGGAEGIIGLRAGSSQTSEFEVFADTFKGKHGEEPTVWSDFGYDTAMVVLKAIEEGGYSADGIQQAMFDVGEDYVGPSGPKNFNEDGIVGGTFEWVTVQDGE